jgi:Fic family protein
MQRNLPELLEKLFRWAKNADVHPLIKSCVFHYEFEFIHPFADGNGRMGRMWQTLMLYEWKPIFAWLPVETIIRGRQQEYYDVLGACDKAADSGTFIEFLLCAIRDTLKELAATDQVTAQVTDQVEALLAAIGAKEMSGKEIMGVLGLKHRPHFRNAYLLPAMELELIEMTIPDKPNSSNQKYRIKR